MNYKNLLFFDKTGKQYNFSFNGSYWTGSLLFDKVSSGLFEIEHIFIVEKMFNTNTSTIEYGIPHSNTNPQGNPTWQTSFTDTLDNGIDVTNILFTYYLSTEATLSNPVLTQSPSVAFIPDYSPSDSFNIDGIRYNKIRDAEKELKISSSTIFRRLNKRGIKNKFDNYQYIT